MEHLESNLPDIINIKCEYLNDLNDQLRVILGLKILHINIRSINKNFDNLKLVINMMKSKPDIIVCTETFKIHYKNFFEIENYEMYFTNDNVNKNDGSCIYINKSIQHTTNEINIGKMKAIFTELKTQKENIYLTTFYRSHDIPIPDFLENLYLHLQKQIKLKNHFVIGDINIDILRESATVNEYINNYFEFGYKSYINSPTRIAADTETCIDHIFGKFSDNHEITSLVCDLDLTDHLATVLVIGDIDMKTETDSRANKKTLLNYNKLVREFDKIKWDCIYNEKDINVALTKFLNILENNIAKSKYTIKINSKNKARKTWITKSLIKSCKVKNQLYKTMKQNPNNDTIKNHYIKYKNTLSNLIKTAKEHYYNEIATNSSNNIKSLWKFINEKLNKTKSREKSILRLESNEEILENEIEIANYLNKFFVEVGPKMAEKLKNPEF